MWTLQTNNAPWLARVYHACVALPDRSIVLIGGRVGGTNKNDVWRSTDGGVSWVRQTAAAPWTARMEPACVALPDGSIVLMSGYDGVRKNDVWRSTDAGVSWVRQTAAAPWTGRRNHTTVALPGGSIVLMAGHDGVRKNDVWLSTDAGVSWVLQTAAAPWTARYYPVAVAFPDSSIVLMGGNDNIGIRRRNDVWRSTDGGVSWVLQTAAAPWTAREYFSAVALPDGSIVLTGGHDGSQKKDVWISDDYILPPDVPVLDRRRRASWVAGAGAGARFSGYLAGEMRGA